VEQGLYCLNEGARLQAARRYVMPNEALDNLCRRVTALAARLLKLPYAAVSIVDAARIWFKSKYGLVVSDIDRQPGLCASAIMSDEPWIVTDALSDARTRTHPLVSSPFGLRFYAGIPLTSPDGYKIGALCVMGHEPRPFGSEDIAILNELAQTLMDGMACMAASLRMSDCAKAPTATESDDEDAPALQESQEWCRALLDLSSDLYWEQDAEFRFRSIVPAPENKCRFHYQSAIGKTLAEVSGIWISNEDKAAYDAALQARRAFHDLTVKWLDDGGQAHYACISGRPIISETGKLMGYRGIARDVTEKMRSQEQLARSHAALRQLSEALQNFREIERKRIARELHDDLAQLLAASRMDLASLRQEMTQNVSFSHRFALLDQLLGSSIVTLRRIATELRPSSLDEGGLYFALKFYLKHFSKEENVECELIADENNLELDEFHSTAVFRVIQEALVNIARQVRISSVRLLLYREGRNLSIMMEYDADGSDLSEGDAQLHEERQLYLLGMRERVWSLNGVIDMLGKPGRGVTLLISIPVAVETHDPQGAQRRQRKNGTKPRGSKAKGAGKEQAAAPAACIERGARRRLIDC